MGLDISFERREKIFCPFCGELVGSKTVEQCDSEGRMWYDMLEKVGYYTDDNIYKQSWYGKDMTLTPDQTIQFYDFVRNNKVFNHSFVVDLITKARLNNDDVVINASW